MATLEKIRSKSVLLVSIIFVALFLFIITIVDNPLGLFMDNTTVVDVNGKKVNIEEYQKRSQEIRQRNPQFEDADEYAIQSLIAESLMQQEFDKLGLVVTPSEISDVLVGENANPYFVNQFMQSVGLSPEDALAAINNPAAMQLTEEQAQQLKDLFKEFENQVEQGLLSQKLFNLLDGTVNANKLDAKLAFDEGNTNYTLAAVSKGIYSVQDSVTDADIQKFYNEHKATYKQQEPSRYVRYVDLPIVPSNADRQAAAEAVQEAMALLADSASVGMDALVGNSAFVIERLSGDETALKGKRMGSLVNFVKDGAIGETRVVVNDAFSPSQPRLVIARLMNRENKANGGTFKQAILDPTQNADSVLARINSATVPVDSVAGVMQVVDQHYDFANLPLQILEDLKAADGKYINLTMNDGSTVATLIEKYDEPKDIYEVQTATFNVEPSRETISDLNTRMRDFMIVASKADAFNLENALQYNLQVEDALVLPSSPSLHGLSDTRGIVAWAMDAKKGDVSRLFTDGKNSHLTVAALVDVYNSDYVPVTYPLVHQEVEMLALNQKRVDKLIADYQGKGKSLADYQKLMEAQRIDTIQNVSLANPGYAKLGGIVGAKKGQLVGPVDMGNTVIVYQIIDSNEGTMPYDETSNSMRYKQMMETLIFGQNNNLMNELLLGNGKIKNRILKFTNQ